MYSGTSSDYMLDALSSSDGIPSGAHPPSSVADVVLIFAGVFLQAISDSESKILNIFYYHQSPTVVQEEDDLSSGGLELPVDLEFLNYVCSWLRSIFAMILLVMVRQCFMKYLSPIFFSSTNQNNNNRNNNINNNNLMLICRDLLFHIQCRLCVGAILCLLPPSTHNIITPATTNCLVLVASTLSQPVFLTEFQSAATTTTTTRRRGGV